MQRGRGSFQPRHNYARGQTINRLVEVDQPYYTEQPGQNDCQYEDHLYEDQYDEYKYEQEKQHDNHYNSHWEPEETYCTSGKSGNKYFANLLLSSTGNDTFCTIKCQIDTAATCNTMPEHMLANLHTTPKLLPSQSNLMPYGGPIIKPRGLVQLVCSRNNKFEILDFQVVPSDQVQNKPPLICGNDSKLLGLVKINADEIHAMEKLPSTPTNLRPPGKLTK